MSIFLYLSCHSYLYLSSYSHSSSRSSRFPRPSSPPSFPSKNKTSQSYCKKTTCAIVFCILLFKKLFFLPDCFLFVCFSFSFYALYSFYVFLCPPLPLYLQHYAFCIEQVFSSRACQARIFCIERSYSLIILSSLSRHYQWHTT